MMRINISSVVFLFAACTFVSAGCDSGGGGGDTDGTTGAASTTGDGSTTMVDPSTSTTSTSTSTTSTTGGPGTSSSSTGSEESSSSSTTGGDDACVDEDIGSAIGQGVVKSTTSGSGDDFSLRYCEGRGGGAESGGGGATSDDGGTSVGSTSVGSTTGGEFDGDDYVVAWTPPSDGLFSIDTFGSDVDTVLSVVDPQCGATTKLCSDDCDGLDSGLVLQATAGEMVFIVIEGFGSDGGGFVLNITEGRTLECNEFGTSSGGGMDSGGTA